MAENSPEAAGQSEGVAWFDAGFQAAAPGRLRGRTQAAWPRETSPQTGQAKLERPQLESLRFCPAASQPHALLR